MTEHACFSDISFLIFPLVGIGCSESEHNDSAITSDDADFDRLPKQKPMRAQKKTTKMVPSASATCCYYCRFINK